MFLGIPQHHPVDMEPRISDEGCRTTLLIPSYSPIQAKQTLLHQVVRSVRGRHPHIATLQEAHDSPEDISRMDLYNFLDGRERIGQSVCMVSLVGRVLPQPRCEVVLASFFCNGRAP